MSEPKRNGGGAALPFLIVCSLLVAGIHCYFQYRIWVETLLTPRKGAWTRQDGQPIAGDFVQFAAVAEAWRRGEIHRVYESLDHQSELMGQAARMPGKYQDTLSYNYPPFYCWLIWPMQFMDYRRGLAYWLALQFSFAVLAYRCWRLELGAGNRWAAVVLAVFLSPPTCNTLLIGHVSFGVLAIFSGFFLLLNRSKDFLAGSVLALLFFKPTLGIVVGPLLVFNRRWRTVAGVAVGGALLGLASYLLSPTACAQFPGIGRELVKLASSHPDFYLRHFNLLALFSNGFQLPPAAFRAVEWIAFAGIVAPLIGLLLYVWRGPWRVNTPAFWCRSSAAVLATLVLTPYLYSYDTVLIGVAGVYTLKSLPHRPSWHSWFVFVCVVAAMAYVAGDKLWLLHTAKYTTVRLQLAPVFLSAWMVLECIAAERLRRESV